MIRSFVCRTLLCLFGLGTASLLALSAAEAAGTADEVCLPTADPCVVATTVAVNSGAVLDFGLRTVNVTGAGKFDFGSGAGSILCGELNVNVNNVGLKVKGPDGFGGTAGGEATITARRACSGDGTTVCLNDSTCALAGLGTCSAGSSGTITLNGKISAAAPEPAVVVIQAVGDILISQQINVKAQNSVDADGGELDIESTKGSLVLDGNVLASSGAAGFGGILFLTAGNDLTINGTIDVNGGEFGGGEIDIDAGGNVTLNEDITADSTNSDGDGGAITVSAGGDLVIDGGKAGNRLLLSTEGHASADGLAGFGGDQDFAAGGRMVFGQFVKMLANGAAPDGDGAEFVVLDAGTDLVVEGEIQAKTKGSQGAGGLVELSSGNDTTIASTATIDLTGGGFGGGGGLDVLPLGNLILHGSVDVSASSGGNAGFVNLDVDKDMVMAGTIVANGTPALSSNGDIDIDTCRLTMNSTATINNAGGFGDNSLTIRESMTLDVGGQLLATSTGNNLITYRDAAKPPDLSGTVSPTATLVVNANLTGCPVCGNNEIDQGESCDDGNTVDGDGCSAGCQDEGCIAQTPGYPAVPLCDDGDGCTQDSCVTSACVHSQSCDDGIACTVDSCDQGTNSCINTPTGSLCDDGNVCTTDICSGLTGCTFANNTNPCDDGIACTINDTCAFGTCSGTSDGSCSVCGNGTVETPEECDSGTPFVLGNPCADDCLFVGCGDPSNTGSISAGDALFALKAAVGTETCALSVCDVNNSNTLTAGDALLMLKVAVGQSFVLTCPSP
ncbi:MAG: hypothetical protein ACE5E4_04380 [Candidatus Binatia bacterium]